MEMKPEVCRNWPEVTKAFDSFEPTKLGWDAERDIDRKAWIFRVEARHLQARTIC